MLQDKRLPGLTTEVPTVRENRLYQADWLMRFYGYKADEIVDSSHPFLDLKMDPKLAWALRHLDQFPVAVQTAPLELILRVPGIGVRSALKIVQARRFQILTLEHLKKMGAAIIRAKYFLALVGTNEYLKFLNRPDLQAIVLNVSRNKHQPMQSGQLSLF